MEVTHGILSLIISLSGLLNNSPDGSVSPARPGSHHHFVIALHHTPPPKTICCICSNNRENVVSGSNLHLEEVTFFFMKNRNSENF
jgi:hypothetical protein